VNLLPIEGQLWLTIDTALWGRMDPDTLETLPAKARAGTASVLNAHPACEADGGPCFVQYGCGHIGIPYTDQVCFSQLQPGESDLAVNEISRATLPKKKLIQHSHEPCLTQNYLISKLDAFEPRNPLLNHNSGLLKVVHQVEDDLWLVMDRRTNTSRVMSSNLGFVNNHFSNCVELPSGEVQIDIVAATENYLDTYFSQKLQKPTDWQKIFHEPIRCLIPETGDSIQCESFYQEGSTGPIFDYPVFNPKYKQNADYKFLYAIAAESSSSRWFDQLVKLDVKDRTVVGAWSAPDVFLTEADFIPRGAAGEPASEDDGVLVSILYNSTKDESSLAFFDAKSLNMLEQHSLGFVAPFHAHGIICESGRPCYTNP
jgi:carotenoid cleavage dioxygenase-like enzyme